MKRLYADTVDNKKLQKEVRDSQWFLNQIWDSKWSDGGFDGVEGAHAYDDVIEFWTNFDGGERRHFRLTLEEILPAKEVYSTKDGQWRSA